MAKLYFYYSAMNAGKTTTLLQSAHNYRERGMRVAILTPRLDDRAGVGVVASRIGLKADGIAFEADTDLQQLVAEPSWVADRSFSPPEGPGRGSR